MSRSVESAAWNNYLSKVSRNPLENISFGDQKLLCLDPEWKVKFDNMTDSLKNESIPDLNESQSQTLSEYFSQMTSVMNEKAKIHKEIALKITSKLKIILQNS
jgi:hypothetical protein